MVEPSCHPASRPHRIGARRRWPSPPLLSNLVFRTDSRRVGPLGSSFECDSQYLETAKSRRGTPFSIAAICALSGRSTAPHHASHKHAGARHLNTLAQEHPCGDPATAFPVDRPAPTRYARLHARLIESNFVIVHRRRIMAELFRYIERTFVAPSDKQPIDVGRQSDLQNSLRDAISETPASRSTSEHGPGVHRQAL
jgi:hypothetical protein